VRSPLPWRTRARSIAGSSSVLPFLELARPSRRPATPPSRGVRVRAYASTGPAPRVQLRRHYAATTRPLLVGYRARLPRRETQRGGVAPPCARDSGAKCLGAAETTEAAARLPTTTSARTRACPLRRCGARRPNECLAVATALGRRSRRSGARSDQNPLVRALAARARCARPSADRGSRRRRRWSCSRKRRGKTSAPVMP
jgi:hypothetical protein